MAITKKNMLYKENVKSSSGDFSANVIDYINSLNLSDHDLE